MEFINPSVDLIETELNTIRQHTGNTLLEAIKKRNTEHHENLGIQDFHKHSMSLVCVELPNNAVLSLPQIFINRKYINEHNEVCIVTSEGYHINVHQYYKDERTALDKVLAETQEENA